MEEIVDQLQIYRIEFSKENEFAYVKEQEPHIDDLFKDKDKIEYDCQNAVAPLENKVKKVEERLKTAKQNERNAYNRYQTQLDKEQRAKEAYEKEIKKANENLDKSKNERYLSESVSYLRKADKALYKAESYKNEVISGNSNELYNVWQRRIAEVKEAEDHLEDMKNKLKHVKQGLEYLTYCDYEKNHYYAAFSEHEFHSKRLESFQCIINNYRDLISKDPNIEGIDVLYKDILNEVDVITKLSIKQYVYLAKEERECGNKKSENGCRQGWRALANRFCILKQDDRTNPRLKRPVMIKMSEYLLEDAEDKNRKSKSEEPDIDEERINSIGISKDDRYYKYYENLVKSREDIISQIDDYYKYTKKHMEKYPKKIEEIINKVSDTLKSKSVKYEKIEKLFNKTIETFEKENKIIDEFIQDEENHPIQNYTNILQNLIYLIETEYYSPLNADIENTVIEPLCFGLTRYQQIRELDHKIERRYNLLVEKEIIDLECNMLPIRKHKQQLVLEGYRNECLSIYPLLLNIMKKCITDNPFNEISDKIMNEIKSSNERLETLKTQLDSIMNKGNDFEKQLFKYRNEIKEIMQYCHEYDEDLYYFQFTNSYRKTNDNINSHITYYRETKSNIITMIESINLLMKLIKNPNGSNAICLMQGELLEIPPLPLEEESKSNSKSLKRNKSAKVAPIPTTMIVVKSKSKLDVEESKKEIELPLYESPEVIKDDKTTTTGESKESNIDDNIPDSLPLEAEIPKQENAKEIKKEESKVVENIIVEVSNAESMYRILKNLLLWKYEILRFYFPSTIQILYSDITTDCNTNIHMYHHEYTLYNSKYHNDFDRLKYSKHGNWNWKLYKNIIKQLNNIKSKYKFIFLNIPEEMDFIQRLYYTISQFCNTSQTKCELILKNSKTYYKEFLKAINGLERFEKTTEYNEKIKKLDDDIKTNIFGEGFRACFSCCIPGICFGYSYAGKKWCDEKNKNEELCRKEIN